MLEVEQCGHTVTGCGQNAKEVITGAASKRFARWLHNRQGSDVQHLHSTTI